ncbi:MAG: hypothetical protein K4571_13435 [Deltaproteobacteria bacterium]
MDILQNQGRQETIYHYAAQKALQDLRTGKPIDPALQQLLNTYPLFNYCRLEVTEEDKPVLKDVAASPQSDLLLRRFALKLLHRFEHHADVKAFFCELWGKSSEYEIKLEVLWSLLSYPDLSEDLYADIGRHFDAANWDKWLPLIVEKLEGDSEEKVHVKELMKRFFNL